MRTSRREQVQTGEWLSVQQFLPERQVQHGELKRQGTADRGQQHRVGQAAGPRAGTERHGELGGAQREERSARAGRWRGPERDAQGDGGDDQPDPDDPPPEPGAEHALGWRPWRPAHHARVGWLAAAGHAGQAVGEQVDPHDLGRQQRQGRARPA